MKSRILQAEFERLRNILKLGYELDLKWIPNKDSHISGEVKRSRIYLYDEDGKVALETLRHEFLDYALSKKIEPYKKVTNHLISLINAIAYERKENLLEVLTKLLINQDQEEERFQ